MRFWQKNKKNSLSQVLVSQWTCLVIVLEQLYCKRGSPKDNANITTWFNEFKDLGIQFWESEKNTGIFYCALGIGNQLAVVWYFGSVPDETKNSIKVLQQMTDLQTCSSG